MRRVLRITALLAATATLVTWAGTGADRGWTKTSRPRITLDEVTGIEGRTYEPCFRPGVDFLGVGLLLSGILAGASFLARPNSKQFKTQT